MNTLPICIFINHAFNSELSAFFKNPIDVFRYVLLSNCGLVRRRVKAFFFHFPNQLNASSLNFRCNFILLERIEHLLVAFAYDITSLQSISILKWICWERKKKKNETGLIFIVTTIIAVSVIDS